MESLIVSLDPRTRGGVHAMSRAMWGAHERIGLSPWLGYSRNGRRERFDWRLRLQAEGGREGSTGYLPSIEYLNYLVPSLAMRRWIHRFPIVQIVSGFHSASMIPILAGKPFVSWVATPFVDEIESRYAAERPGASVRLNYRLRRINQAIERWSYRFPGKAFALSDYTARRLSAATGLPRERFDVLRYPIDVDRFTPDGPRWQNAPRRYCISVGRVDDERKNVPSLLRAFSPLARKHRDLDLVVLGAVQKDGAVVRLARELDIGARVHFPGPLHGAELAAAYRGAEMYVMTSRQEGLGIVVLEAQASGLTPLLMRCGGSDELVEEGETGWLVDQGDEDAFRKRWDALLGEPALRRRVGLAARGRVEKYASLDVFARRVAKAYEEVFGAATDQRFVAAMTTCG